MSDAQNTAGKSFSQGTTRNANRPSNVIEMASNATETPVSASQGIHETNIPASYPASSSQTSRIPEAHGGFRSDVLSRFGLDQESSTAGHKETMISQETPNFPVQSVDSRNTKDMAGSQSSTTYQDQVAKHPLETQFQSLEDDDDLELDDINSRPKRYSKNMDTMLGRSPAGTTTVPDEQASDISYEAKPVPNEEGVYPNGYSFPKSKPWTEATVIGLKASLRYTFTPLGFFIVLYGLNVVAWGGMLFLLLCNASPAMCRLGDGTYDCNYINSPRRVWVEIDSQIVNALFCVTGFGLIPWRFRDLYYWAKWRIGGKQIALRKLAGYHNGWFRLPNSDRVQVEDFRESHLEKDEINPALPYPLKKVSAPPLTGARAPATALWKMDTVIWAFVWNTFLQAVLCGFMWGLNRIDRPSWSTGLFVALACIVAAVGGIIQFREAQKIKKVEGVPTDLQLSLEDLERSNGQRNLVNAETTVGRESKKASPG